MIDDRVGHVRRICRRSSCVLCMCSALFCLLYVSRNSPGPEQGGPKAPQEAIARGEEDDVRRLRWVSIVRKPVIVAATWRHGILGWVLQVSMIVT